NSDDVANLFAEKIKDPNMCVDDKPILAEAVEKGFDKTAATLVKRQANADISAGYWRNTPLIHLAVNKKLLKTVTELAKDESLHEKLHDKKTPLVHALDLGWDEGAAALVRAGANCRFSHSGKDETIHSYLKSRGRQFPKTGQAVAEKKIPLGKDDKVDLNTINSANISQLNPLQKNQLLTQAIKDRRWSSVIDLIKDGANPNPENATIDEHPLFAAIEHNHQDLFELCLAGIKAKNLNAQYKSRLSNNRSPLQFAMKQNKYAFAIQLIRHGVDVNVDDGSDVCSSAMIFEAIDSGNEELVKAFKEAGASLDVTDNIFTKTPFLYAVKKKKMHLARLLFRKGTDDYHSLLENPTLACTKYVLEHYQLTELDTTSQIAILQQHIEGGEKESAKKQLGTLTPLQQQQLIQGAEEHYTLLHWLLVEKPIATPKGTTIGPKAISSALAKEDTAFVAKLLSEYGVEPSGTQLLERAIQDGNEEIFQACLTHPSSLNKEKYIRSPLEWALKRKKYNFAERIYEEQTNKEHQAMLKADDQSCVEKALTQHPLNKCALKEQITCLKRWVKLGWKELVIAQIATLNDAQKKSVFESSDLSYALCCFFVTEDVIPPGKGYVIHSTFLDQAIDDKNFDIVKRIMQLGKRLSETYGFGTRSFVFYAIENNLSDLLQILCDQGYSLDQRQNGKLPSSYALEKRYFDEANILLKAGASFVREEVICTKNETFIRSYFTKFPPTTHNDLCVTLNLLLSLELTAIADEQLKAVSSPLKLFLFPNLSDAVYEYLKSNIAFSEEETKELVMTALQNAIEDRALSIYHDYSQIRFTDEEVNKLLLDAIITTKTAIAKKVYLDYPQAPFTWVENGQNINVIDQAINATADPLIQYFAEKGILPTGEKLEDAHFRDCVFKATTSSDYKAAVVNAWSEESKEGIE
ncbi:MAG: hypothetical protein KDK44_00750, partial [Chlamydiia bacterium]|nr:hypothetical protein [Chlamydiia bacterium]